jgi:hypothetical protein
LSSGDGARQPARHNSRLRQLLNQLPQDSLEAEAAEDQRQLEQWRSQKLGR